MGSFFTNIHAKSVDIAEVKECLQQANFVPAYLLEDAQWTSIFPEATESQDWEILETMCEDLSKSLNTSVIGAVVHDSDILNYVIYEAGLQADLYDSDPGYWDGEEELPNGGNVAVLSKLSTIEIDDKELERILRKPSSAEDEEFIFANDRWYKIARLLGIDLRFITSGFQYLSEDPESAANLMLVTKL
ncbi:MAG: hypothetical protein ACRD3W_00020 [Terriglobales bacterium]